MYNQDTSYTLYQMITKNFEDYPEHRLKFFSLLRAIGTHCFQAFIQLSSQVNMNLVFHLLNYIYNSIITYAYYACKSLVDCFPDYFICLFQQLKLVMDSISWAFRHTERNIAETGLSLLLEILKNFEVLLFCSILD
jgi:exportin-1